MNLPLPQSLSSKDWNVAVNSLNIDERGKIDLIDQKLNLIEDQKSKIEVTIDSLTDSKKRARMYLDYLTDLNNAYKAIKAADSEEAALNLLKAYWPNLRVYTKYNQDANIQ